MDLQERRRLQAERSELERLLSMMPETSVIDRLSLQLRKEAVESALSETQYPVREPIQVELTFRGKLVVGNHGIFAEFGAEAINKFVNAVAAFAASQIAPLGTRGNIPNREKYQLLITGTALGSFGFNLEEYLPIPMLPIEEQCLVEKAIEQARVLLEASLASDDELASAAVEADPRAIDTLHDFVKVLAEQEALCTLQFRDKTFSFRDVGEVRRSAERLSRNNIHEEEKWLEGTFQGVLPKRRTFEFKITISNEIIEGRVGPNIIDASVINSILGKQIRIKVLSTRVGEGRPRFILLEYEDPINNLMLENNHRE